MSISNEILRLQTAKDNLKNSIQNKGVEVKDTDLIDSYHLLVDQIQCGSSVTDLAIFVGDYYDSNSYTIIKGIPNKYTRTMSTV